MRHVVNAVRGGLALEWGGKWITIMQRRVAKNNGTYYIAARCIEVTRLTTALTTDWSSRMIRSLTATALACAALFTTAAIASDSAIIDANATSASDEGFDPKMSGRWVGGGDVLVRIDGKSPFKVKCEVDVNATEAKFNLGGECGALFMKRPFNVVLERTADGVEGTYDAKLRTGQATLEGPYAPDAIELDITWGGEVNGDTSATMTIERPEPDSLRVQVVDRDPATGDDVVTSDLTLTREG